MTQDEIIEMARQVGVGATGNEYWPFFIEELKAFANLVAAKEREACEEDIEGLMPDADRGDCANAIRARGEQA